MFIPYTTYLVVQLVTSEFVTLWHQKSDKQWCRAHKQNNFSRITRSQFECNMTISMLKLFWHSYSNCWDLCFYLWERILWLSMISQYSLQWNNTFSLFRMIASVLLPWMNYRDIIGNHPSEKNWESFNKRFLKII